MKQLLSFLLALLGMTAARAQTFSFEWARQVSGASAAGQGCTTHVTDSAGNVYVGGYFNGKADLDPGPGAHPVTSLGQSDLFVMKLDRDGHMIWVRVIGGTAQQRMEHMVLNKGQLICTGTFRNGDVDFDPGPGTYMLGAGTTNTDGFVLKLDTSGNYQWAKAFQGGLTSIGGLVVDDLAEIYVGGSLQNSVDIDPGTAMTTITAPASTEYAYMVRLDPGGNMIWFKIIEGGPTASVESLCLDAAGTLYAGGRFSGAADFDPGSGVTTLSTGSASVLNGFVMQLSRSGILGWAKSLHDTLNSQVLNVLAGPGGTIYLNGVLQGKTDFDPGPGVYELTSKGWLDNFVAKYSDKGDFIWARSFGGKNQDECPGAAVDKEGNVYLSGHFLDTVDFDPGPGLEQHIASYWDPFMIKFDSAGLFRWVQHIKSTAGALTGIGWSISADDSGNVYGTGTFNGKADFDTGPGLFEMTATNSEGYILKFLNCDLNNKVTLTGGILEAASASGSYQWVRCPGGIVIPGATARTYIPLISGSYAVIISNGACIDSSACIDVTITTGVAESAAAMGLSVVPNPSAGAVTLSLDHYVPGARLSVLDLSGRQVISRELKAVTYIEDLFPGFYILQVTNNGITASTKLWVR